MFFVFFFNLWMGNTEHHVLMIQQLMHSASLVKHGLLENSPFVDGFLIKTTSIGWEFPCIFFLESWNSLTLGKALRDMARN